MVTKAEPEKFPFDNTKEAGKKGEKTAYVKGNTIVMLVIIVLVCASLALIGRYVSDNSFVIKTKVDRKRNKLRLKSKTNNIEKDNFKLKKLSFLLFIDISK